MAIQNVSINFSNRNLVHPTVSMLLVDIAYFGQINDDDSFINQDKLEQIKCKPL